MSQKQYKLKQIILPNNIRRGAGEYSDRQDRTYLKPKRGPNFQPKKKRK